jgi:biotin operon repressor
LGGTVNYAISRPAKAIRNEAFSRKEWFWCVILGIGASFLMPLFLNTISSTLLSGILQNQPADRSAMFVFGGFCLLGAIASRAMIRSLSEKILQDLKKETEEAHKEALEAHQKTQELEDDVAPIIAKETEHETSTTSTPPAAMPFLPEELEVVLDALGSSKYSWRSVSGISAEIGKDRDAVAAKLRELEGLGLAAEVRRKKGLRWALTDQGRAMLAPPAFPPITEPGDA